MAKVKQEKLRVPYGFSVHGQEEIDAVVEVLRGNTAIGDRTTEFEAQVAKMFGKKYGVMVNSGSSANLLAFELLNLPQGSEVITPALTFATVVAPIVQKGLVPVFIDVDPTTYLVNMDQLKKAITKKTKALMIPSLMGNIPNMKELAAIAKKHKLFFIEDSCDTLGGKFEGKPTGLHSHISVTSFYGSHIINGAGGGGMIMVNDEKWEQRLKVLRGWGRQSSLYGEKANSELLKNRFNYKLGGIPYDNKFIFSEVGYNFLPLEISSAFALTQMKRLPGFIEKRRINFENLMKYIGGKDKYFILPTQTPNTETVWLAFPIIIKKNAPFTRLDIVTYLENANIQTRPVFAGNILKQPGYKKIINRKIATAFPNTDFIMKNAFVLACHHGLDATQIKYVQDTINTFFGAVRINNGNNVLLYMSIISIQNQPKQTICPICNNTSKTIDTVATINPHDQTTVLLLECVKCRHWWHSPLPDQSTLDDFYTNASEYVVPKSYPSSMILPRVVQIDPLWDKIYESVSRYSPYNLSTKNFNYLELGIGSGGLFDFFKKRAKIAYGIEPGKWISCDTENIVPSVNDLRDEVLFDVIVAHDVLEHLHNPTDMLTKLHAHANKGCIIHCAFPNKDCLKAHMQKGKWHMVRPFGHLHYFSKKSVEKMMADAGFKIIKLTQCRIAENSTLDLIKDFDTTSKKMLYRLVKSLLLGQIILGKDQWTVVAISNKEL